MKKVLSARIEKDDIRRLKERAKSMNFTLPELLASIARNGEHIEDTRLLIEKFTTDSRKEIENLARSIIEKLV